MAMEDWRCKCGHLTYFHKNEGMSSYDTSCGHRPRKGKNSVGPLCKCTKYQPVGKKVRS